MSNVKRILIQGDLDTMALMSAPSHVTEDTLELFSRGSNIPRHKVGDALEAAKRIKELLAFTTLPHFGLKVYFDKIPCRSEKNGHGGKTSYFQYAIEGQEAVAFGWFDSLSAALEIFGKVRLRVCKDMEE